MGDLDLDRIDRRFVFWATYLGGDPTETDKMRWITFTDGSGGCLRHEDAEPKILRRFDRDAGQHGIHPAGTAFDRSDGVWRESEGAYRNHYRGGDYGDVVSTAEATEILIGFGYPAETLTADPVPEPRRQAG
ncbi:hypothetical protein Q0Z83_036690 [Actinoplanes sichuanensis]|uniref:Uncharacterized protein n=1 Tax=Actinoplanes sichuanensis TaxID=512349 RepID=A0ABW4APB2_9ACTN|nr:hypothetical protein [Actinoplanes sichuanensis]BEL05478.1 hypothetical protein Q0Z83_036690 [Actinoplanes sichuanensis]